MTKTSWVLAKYMKDLPSREPRNVGVMLFHDGKVYARFRGENDSGALDGRVARRFVASTENYKDWVHRWRYEADRVSTQEGFAKMVRQVPSANYFLEASGRVIHGDVSDPRAMLDRLYKETMPADRVREDRSHELVTRAFERAGILEKIQDDPFLELEGDHLFFDYSYSNGVNNLFRRLSLRDDKPGWRSVHDTAWAISRIAESSLRDPPRVIALVERHDEKSESLLTPLAKVNGLFVDIGTDNAGDALRTIVSPIAVRS